MKYKVGDRVKIIDRWKPYDLCRQNDHGLMDRWLGTVMTIAGYDSGFYLMEEDVGTRQDGENIRWFWNDHCIAGLADSEPDVDSKLFDSML